MPKGITLFYKLLETGKPISVYTTADIIKKNQKNNVPKFAIPK